MKPKIFSANEHKIDLKLVDPDAVFVIHKLREAGHSAYLVGGSVRDLLCGHIPKDYDISTSATPEQTKKLFQKRCLLIGRRFRLAHIRFGKKVFEVATFRAGEDESDLIIRDNEWGTEESDVLRRDFTINGLYYDPIEQKVIDYIEGHEDLKKQLIRTIGDANVRFKQDPVRMLRLLKFRARFGFTIDPDTRKALVKNRMEIIKSSPARVLEELFRMLESGAAAPFFRLMADTWLLELLIPKLTHFLKEEKGQRIYQYLHAADHYNKEKHPLHRAVLLSALLYPMLEEDLAIKMEDRDEPLHLGDVIQSIAHLIRSVVISSFSHFPRRLISSAHYILCNQYRFTPLGKKKQIRNKLFENKEFELSLDFFKIRAAADESLRPAYYEWARHYQLHKQQTEHRKHHHPAPEPKS